MATSWCDMFCTDWEQVCKVITKAWVEVCSGMHGTIIKIIAILKMKYCPYSAALAFIEVIDKWTNHCVLQDQLYAWYARYVGTQTRNNAFAKRVNANAKPGSRHIILSCHILSLNRLNNLDRDSSYTKAIRGYSFAFALTHLRNANVLTIYCQHAVV